MMDDVKIALADLGLAPKEAETYIAMLELGPASVQDIAKKAGINRTTTYVMLEGLKRHGLVSTFEKGKKTLFSAENPEQLVEILTRQSQVINAKKSKLEESLPRLLAIFNSTGDKPRVRFLEGEEPMREIMQKVNRIDSEVWEMFAVDEYLLEALNKFQTHEIEDEQLNINVVSPHFKGADRVSWITRNMEATPFETFWKPLKEYCDEIGILFFSTPMSRKAAM